MGEQPANHVHQRLVNGRTNYRSRVTRKKQLTSSKRFAKRKEQDFLKFASIIVPIFTSSGYFYLKSYYKTFGIDFQDFVSLSDCLRTSIEVIPPLLLVWFVMSFPWLLGSDSPMGIIYSKPNRNTNNKGQIKSKKLYYISWMLLGILFPIGYKLLSIKYIQTIYLVAYWFSFIVVALCIIVATKKKYEGSFHILFALLFYPPLAISLLAFLGNAHASHVMNAPQRPIEISFSVNMSEQKYALLKQPIFIGASSDYLFFYDKETSKSAIIPAKNIAMLSQLNKK